MGTPTEEFFDELNRRHYVPILASMSGTVRLELVQGVCTEHWYIEVDNGQISVTRENAEADAAFRADHALFDRAAAGEENLMAALLRGAVCPEGDLELVVMLERLLPGPPQDRRRPAMSVGSSPS